MSFGDAFSFGRPSAAPYVDAAGVTRVAPGDTPRFDHLGPGRPRGLLVETGAALGQGDRVRLHDCDWSASATWTVLHDWEDVGAVRQDAFYTATPAAAIDSCISRAGWHRRVAACPGYLVNYGGWVWALGQRWTLAGRVADGRGRVLVTELGKQLLLG